MKHFINAVLGALGIAVLFSTHTFAERVSTDPDVYLSAQLSFSDARSAAMAGAGCALLGPMSAATLNPALPNAFLVNNQITRGVISLGYARDSLFGEHVVPEGICYNLGSAGTIGISYRYLRQSATHYQHEGTLNLSGRLFEKSLSQGAVDYGISIRYERTRWIRTDLDSAFSLRTDTTAPIARIFSGLPAEGTVFDQRFIVDLGFFQKNVADRLDFGLSVHNLLAYAWKEHSPTLLTQHIPLSYAINDTTHRVDSSQVTSYLDSNYYSWQSEKTQGWLPASYRRITVGIAYTTPILEDKVTLIIPADLAFIGLFDRGTPTRMTLRAGVEARFLGYYALRFGYASAPMVVSLGELISKGSKINENLIIGGGGFSVSPFAADLYISKNNWGLTLTFML